MSTPWTPDTLPGNTIVTVVMVFSGDDIATLKRSQLRAAELKHDDQHQLADILRRLHLAFEDRAQKLQKDSHV